MDNRSHELEERTACFAEKVIEFCRSIKETSISKPMIIQLIRAATSIGANYCEANNASSRRDFKSKIFICKKESHETKYWLRLLKSFVDDRTEINKLMNECHQFNLIFQKIVSTMGNDK
jgi:four helix bundle protein